MLFLNNVTFLLVYNVYTKKKNQGNQASLSSVHEGMF